MQSPRDPAERRHNTEYIPFKASSNKCHATRNKCLTSRNKKNLIRIVISSFLLLLTSKAPVTTSVALVNTYHLYKYMFLIASCYY